MGSDSAALAQVDDDRVLLLRSVFGAVGVVAGAFLVSILLGNAVFVLSGVESQAALRARTQLYSVYTALSSAGFVVAALGYLSLRDEWEILHVRHVTVRDGAVVLAGVVVLAVVNSAVTTLVTFVLAALESVFGTAVEFGTHSVIASGRRNPTYFLYLIPVSLLVVGPGEELVFRGVVQGLFRRVIGVTPAIVVASCVFGLGHLAAISSGSAWPYVFVTVVLGVVLGALYEYTENIVVPAAVHGCWNAAIYATQWLDATNTALPF